MFSNQGKAGFMKHAKSKTHKHNADGRNRRLPAQLTFNPPAADSQNNAPGLTDDEDDSEGEEASESADNSSQGAEEGVSPGLLGNGRDRGGECSGGTVEKGGQGNQVSCTDRGAPGPGVHGRRGESSRVSHSSQAGGSQSGGSQVRGSGDKGGGITRRRVNRPASQRAPQEMSFNDRIDYAETRWVLKVVESDISYLVNDNIQAVMSSMDPGSEILSRMSLNRSKISNMVRFGLFPNIRERLVRRIKAGGDGGGYFTLGTDSSTIKHLGIQKHVDLNIRYWDEGSGQVEDSFIDLHSVGHEPATLQVEGILKSFSELGLPLVKMISISRDNPNVMKTVFRLLKEKVTEAGNPALLDLICYLHPTHTAFQKCCQMLTQPDDEEDEDENGLEKVEISSLLGSLHGWFNCSTARREDLKDIGEGFYEEYEDFDEKLDQFFKRHVSTRWLEMGPCLKRLLSRY